MRVLITLDSGDMVEFEVNEAGVIGTGNYFPRDHPYAIPIKPSVADVITWLDEGTVLDIRFRNEKEIKNLIRRLVTDGRARYREGEG